MQRVGITDQHLPLAGAAASLRKDAVPRWYVTGILYKRRRRPFNDRSRRIHLDHVRPAWCTIRRRGPPLRPEHMVDTAVPSKSRALVYPLGVCFSRSNLLVLGLRTKTQSTQERI